MTRHCEGRTKLSLSHGRQVSAGVAIKVCVQRGKQVRTYAWVLANGEVEVPAARELLNSEQYAHVTVCGAR